MAPIRKKVCIAGAPGVGKTSLLQTFVYGAPDPGAQGLLVAHRLIERPGTDGIDLAIWDEPGGESLDANVKKLYRGAAGILLVCDLTRPETVSALVYHIPALRSAYPDAVLAFAGNKADSPECRVPEVDVTALGHAYDAPALLTSAITGQGVDALFEALAVRMVE
ncbi:MAG: Rab family GTPase [Bacteroidota bacterium]